MENTSSEPQIICQHNNCNAPATFYCQAYSLSLCSLCSTLHYSHTFTQRFTTPEDLQTSLLLLSNSLELITQLLTSNPSLSTLLTPPQNSSIPFSEFLTKFQSLQSNSQSPSSPSPDAISRTILHSSVQELYQEFRRSYVYEQAKEFMFSTAVRGLGALKEKEQWRSPWGLKSDVEKNEVISERDGQIEELKRTVENGERRYEKSQRRVVELGKKITQMEEEHKYEISKLLNSSEVADSKRKVEELYLNIFGQEMEFDKNTQIELKMKNRKAKEFLQSLIDEKVRIPDMKKLKIDQDSKEDASIKEFFTNCFPNKVDIFCYNWDSTNCGNMPISYYFKEFMDILPNIQKEVVLHSMKINKEELEQILTAKTDTLIFNVCTLETSDPLNLDIPESNLKLLSFQSCGNTYKSDWPSTPSKYENIFAAIAKSGLKDSLKTLNVYGSGVPYQDIHQSVISHNLSTIKIKFDTGETPYEYDD